jgi:hypothetical protein
MSIVISNKYMSNKCPLQFNRGIRCNDNSILFKKSLGPEVQYMSERCLLIGVPVLYFDPSELR